MTGNPATTTPLTEDYLAQVEARTNAAENGWHLVEDPEDPYRFEIHGDGPTRVAVFGGDPDDASASYPTEENARFAVHARRDVPALLAEVRRLRAVVAHQAEGLAGIADGIEFDAKYRATLLRHNAAGSREVAGLPELDAQATDADLAGSGARA